MPSYYTVIDWFFTQLRNFFSLDYFIVFISVASVIYLLFLLFKSCMSFHWKTSQGYKLSYSSSVKERNFFSKKKFSPYFLRLRSLTVLAFGWAVVWISCLRGVHTVVHEAIWPRTFVRVRPSQRRTRTKVCVCVRVRRPPTMLDFLQDCGVGRFFRIPTPDSDSSSFEKPTPQPLQLDELIVVFLSKRWLVHWYLYTKLVMCCVQPFWQKIFCQHTKVRVRFKSKSYTYFCTRTMSYKSTTVWTHL